MRKIIQFQVVNEVDCERTISYTQALCDDGSLWYWNGEEWTRIDDIPQDTHDVANLLNIPMNKDENEPEVSTIKDYLKALLIQLAEKREGFSGKRPFGNSDWTYDLARAFIEAGVLKGKIDSDGDIDIASFDKKENDNLFLQAINQL